ncbi:hypothetical protein M885DRAFT_553263 [Pelagophyceae sp. CCMP2097]|nr:hypothetical protein M885DRAFT_553263 [Pelagophyceae sp. CCMP2097]
MVDVFDGPAMYEDDDLLPTAEDGAFDETSQRGRQLGRGTCAVGGGGRDEPSPPRCPGKRSGSPEPPRDRDDELAGLISPEDVDGETEPAWNAELEGFEYKSEATGLYSGDTAEPRIPKDLVVKLVDLGSTPEQKRDGTGLFKACECNADQFADVFAAMVAPDEFDRRVKADAPVGSWALYVDKYAFIDGVDKCEFRFDVVPGDGLSAAGTRSTFSARSIEVKCDLADHRAGPRSWTFAFRTAGDILPGRSRVKIFPDKCKVRVVVHKLYPGLWPKPGTLYAPVTTQNYLQLKLPTPSPF